MYRTKASTPVVIVGRMKHQNDSAVDANNATKRNLSIMRKLSDVTLTYSGIMQARMATYARVGFHNDRAVGVKSLGYETY